MFCGCSSMAEHQLPKLNTRVRFPSSAPKSGRCNASPAFFAIAFGIYYKESCAMKELYLALMDRTFDAYGVDGETVTAAMTAAAPSAGIASICLSAPNRTEKAAHRPTSVCCFCMGSKRRAGRFRRFGGGNAEFFPIGAVERGIIGKAALRKHFCRRCTGQDQLPCVHEPFDLDVVPDR